MIPVVSPRTRSTSPITKVPMQQFVPGIQAARSTERGARAYELARDVGGRGIDIIVHCHNELDLPGAIKVAEAVEPIKPLFLEDPLAPEFSDAWVALRRTATSPLMVGENIALAEGAGCPFCEDASCLDCLQPDLINCGGISAAKRIADLAALYRIPVSCHNVSGYVLLAVPAVLGGDLQLPATGVYAERCAGAGGNG